jgi:hypothetical protein
MRQSIGNAGQGDCLSLSRSVEGGVRGGQVQDGVLRLTPSTAEAGERLIPKQHAFTHAPVPPRKEETRVSSPASEAREGDPWRCAREWIPFPSAPAGNDTTVMQP